ncbi:MAG: 5-(carboxyamino)imidazole ribonucleotide synthase, partial [Chitinophagaceae bacterium]
VNNSFNDEDTVYDFGKDCDIVTVEIEHVSVNGLKRLEAEGVCVAPSSAVIELIQDKGLQKNFFKANNIPTSDFLLINEKADLKNNLDFLPAFQKLRREGYDGRGVQKIRKQEDIEKAFEKPSVLEKQVDIAVEFSVLSARSTTGEVIIYEPVEMHFHEGHNILDKLIAPSELSKEVIKKSREIAVQVVELLDYHGIMAIEMFLDKSGEIYVNELAPRPHNSGHQTIEGAYTSQYDQHFRAISGLPLGNPDFIWHTVMINLLGEEGHSGEVVYEGLAEVLKIQGVFVHLYGKKLTRPWRKMGHITVMSENREDAVKKAEMARDMIKVTSK